VTLMMGAGWGRGTGVVAAQKSVGPTLPNIQDPTMPSTMHPGAMPPDGMPDMRDAATRAHTHEERVKALNDDRHKRLEDDASKLLALSNELKSDVDRANKDELSLDVMRKAAEIEKLAHEVQSRMKN
jgi:hypothetical protein